MVIPDFMSHPPTAEDRNLARKLSKSREKSPQLPRRIARQGQTWPLPASRTPRGTSGSPAVFYAREHDASLCWLPGTDG